MQKSRDERRAHLRLEEDCIKIGGYDSREYRGLLAHHLKTEIPTGKKICLCHACNYHWCSNPNHLYWGTYSDNILDMQECGVMAVSKKPKPIPLAVLQEETRKKVEYLKTVDRSKIGWVEKAAKHLGVSHTNVRKLCDENGLERAQRKPPRKS